ISIISDNSSDSHNTSDSASTSQISTSKEIVHSYPKSKSSKAPSKSLLMWYKDVSDEYKERFWCSKSGGNKTNAKPSFSDIPKAKACILAKASMSSSKAKVQPFRSKAKASGSKAIASLKRLIFKSHVPITNYVLGLANAKT
nr:hypothetical protein [Tanacetum cinerariifolium]